MRDNLYPPQPPISAWRFPEALKQSPYREKIVWEKRAAEKSEADLGGGVRLERRLPDERRLLDTATEDFERFLATAGIPANGPYAIRVESGPTKAPEGFRMVVDERLCRVIAADTEGARRALYRLQDEMTRLEGPFLPLGEVERWPIVKTRLSRCFYGPIKRPPRDRDELLEETDYYPEGLLSRLARDGVNALWLTVEFRDICRSSLIPEYGREAEPRLTRLREIVGKCLRWGIKIYLLCVEPKPIPLDSPILTRVPELGGHRDAQGARVCPESKSGQRYLEEAVRSVWEAVPDLGGLFNGSFGERPTLCHNAGARNNCPRCSRTPFWSGMVASLAAMRRGLDTVNPAAELIADWYVPNPSAAPRNGSDFDEAVRHMPKGVTVMVNFESGVEAFQLGRKQIGNDYWLSVPGPSGFFRERALVAGDVGVRMGAIVMIGCSHEVATVSHAPVPELVYEKFLAINELNVTTYRQGWYFGTDPSLMTRAAAELSFAPFPDKDAFLRRLAEIHWGRSNAAVVVEGWKRFAEGYRDCPLNLMFSYYGPSHDGPVWPLYLVPRDLPLNPTWLVGTRAAEFPPNGDRIGECVGYSHTPEQTMTLLRRRAERWREGLLALAGLKKTDTLNADRRRDIATAEALGVQFDSAANIVAFYLLREELPWLDNARRGQALDALGEIVQQEIANSRALATLCHIDPRLGFHAEAEGYKYFPERLKWRVRQLEALLKTEFPETRRRIDAGEDLFPEHTGKRVVKPICHCRETGQAPAMSGDPTGGAWDAMDTMENTILAAFSARGYETITSNPTRWKARWKLGRHGEALYFGGVCPRTDAKSAFETLFPKVVFDNEEIVETFEIAIEPRRLWPPEVFAIGPDGRAEYRAVSKRPNPTGWDVEVRRFPDRWSFTARIPLTFFEGMVRFARPVRFNALHRLDAHRSWAHAINAWTSPSQEAFVRLAYGFDSARENGWVAFV